eukprot:CAMPEP_0183733468 /NCGR_PEP_ID=MMETSP0737-20130205/41292_1 /TAXON_ID=385413 /ORGANISM="Thalassiosira miniscula, Strain CCMP1093" /LENGTH=838 /DNA_ID=CAMNT_0025966733 /DNA_START=158 /DNA_END=2674 /DNA_ORIENTATION=-
MVRCTNTSSLHAALLAVTPGDEIVLSPGTYYDEDGVSGYAAHFPADVDGTSNARITLRGEDPDNPPLLMGAEPGSRTVLRVFGDYWTVKDLAVTNAQKGIIFDNANFGEIINCHVYGIGYEGIHIRDGSDNCLVEGCNVHDTGIRNQGFGEAIYVGTDGGSWSRYDPYVWNTTIRNCTLGPNVAAEAFDIKEGTQNTLIEFNTVDATGISKQNFADSFVDLKAARAIVRYNTFIRNGAEKLYKGIAIIYRGTEYSAYEHVIHDNYFYLDGVSNIPLVASYSGSRDIYAFNNVREPSSPADDDYASIVITECCPPWYTPPSNGFGVCTAPYNLRSTEVSNTTALLTWSTVGTNTTTYIVQYQEFGQVYATEVNVTEGSSIVLTDLTPSTVHNWKVVSVCGDRSSAPASGAAFLTLDDGDDDPPPPPGAIQIYTDGLIGFWNDYSWGGTYDFDSIEEIKVGGKSIKADYIDYGGLNLKHSRGGIDSSNLGAIRFWVKGDSIVNGPGNPTLQLRVNAQEYDFEIINDQWEIHQVLLEEFGSPSTIEAVVIQNRQGSELRVFIDQIELLAAEDPTPQPSRSPTTQAPTKSNEPSLPVTSNPTHSPSIVPSKNPTLTPIVVTESPTSGPIISSESPTIGPTTKSTNSPSNKPTPVSTSESSENPTSQPNQDCVLVCKTPSPVAPPPVTLAPIATVTSTFTIYDEVIANGWDDYSWSGTFDSSYSLQSHEGAVSFQASLNGWGGVNLKAGSPGLLLSDLGSGADATNVSLRFWMKCAGTASLRVRVNGKMHDISISSQDQWVQVSLGLNLFESPANVFQIEIQNKSSTQITIYFDEIELHKNVF